jgi:uncharacterized protein with HEPN domain
VKDELVHDYLGVDMERVWEIVHRDLEPLKSVATDLLHRVEGKS